METEAAVDAQLNISKEPSEDGDDEKKDGPVSEENDDFSDKESDIL